mmetsp:Transcript_1883/g.6741  ORF Transcript_1883/g.6741 Transcript_1883/m.6741 type:complete len:340 (-) Transcript_1883:65-1084(-)
MLMTDAWWLSKDGWWVSHIEIDRYSEADSIEFVLTNGDGDWDKAHHGGNLQASLEHKVVCVIGGKVEPVTQAPPIMLISDLDGTMIGDDEATARFSAFWEARHEAAGSMLVYSTGRSLASVEELLKDKEGILAEPDMLITGVGTQVWLRDSETSSWVEDQEWAATLRFGWDPDVVERAFSSMKFELTSKDADAIVEQDSSQNHDYKFSCLVKTEWVEYCMSKLERMLKDERQHVKLVVSGTGDHMYVDCIPENGGKLPALVHVRSKYRIPLHRTIACGDSGNDIDMLNSGGPAIAVSNAQPALVNWLNSHEAAEDQQIILSNSPMADGIIEGLDRLGFV